MERQHGSLFFLCDIGGKIDQRWKEEYMEEWILKLKDGKIDCFA